MTAAEILQAIARRRALVVGDLCLDRWCTYDPALGEPSRETGLPRTGVVSVETTPGAAGTVANNLAALGVSVAVMGVMGDDGHGFELGRALVARHIATDLCVRSGAVPTFTYTKLLNLVTGEEDLGRVDYVYTKPMPQAVEDKLISNLQSHIQLFDVVLVSDQAETEQGGVITPRVREAICRLAASHPERLFWVDSRLRAELFRNVVLKPNEREAGEACARAFGHTDYARLQKLTAAPYLVVTHGPHGATIVRDGALTLVATRAVEHPVDICGAGDSFSAGAALALAVTNDPREAVQFGHLVASVTIMKKGTGTASPQEVLEAETQLG